jgi:hypothetical protein
MNLLLVLVRRKASFGFLKMGLPEKTAQQTSGL